MNRIYSLFLLPEEDVVSPYRIQKFKLHLTLIKNLELKEKEVLLFTNELIKHLKAIKTRFVDFGYSDRFYRSLYITVLKTPDLMQAHNRGKLIFRHTEEPFMPHISIFYGELSLDDKLKIIESLGPLNKKYFILDKLVVYDITAKNADLWKEVGCFDLKM